VTEFIELVVVGAGPAGMAAAIEAAGLGLSVALVDVFARPGGQYFKQTPPELEAVSTTQEKGQWLVEGLERAEIQVLTGTVVWGIFAEEDGYLLCLYGPPGTPRRMKAKAVILAPGAHDRPVPFPGWTLPGVMTAGAALAMVKHQKVLPGRRILLSGTGPLQLVLARHLIEAGAEIAGVLDANGFPWRGWRHARAVWGQWERLGEGWQAWRVMRRAGVGIRWGNLVFRAEGDGQLEEVTIGPLDGSRPEIVVADTLCLGHGFVPGIQLSRLAGCEHQYRPEQAAYVPVRNEWLETTLAGVFVAGDGAGIGGKDVALLEGQLAAVRATRRLGREADPDKVSNLRRDLARQRRFAAVLDDLFPLSSNLGNLLTDDTVLCRCEEVTVGDVRRAIGEGASTVSAIRMLTRAGMGRCQGRMCGAPVAELLARQLDQPVASVGQATPRPPVVPIPLQGMLEADD
jgi:NADPH-dependent 2,4-dienoyl-CoA reductase/sulfur reductase-like enzyme